VELERFGFTSTESRVYLALLRQSPATGYVVAREAGLARANAYSALESLAARGAVSRLPGRPARFVAEEPEALVSRLGRESQRDLERLARSLAGVARRVPADAGQAVVLLHDRGAVLERCASCARAAREELLAVVGPWVSELFADLAVSRRSRVAAKVLSLGTPAPAGALVRPVVPAEIESYWGGFPVALVADRRRAVCAVGRGDTAVGIASDHPALVPFVRHLLRREIATAAAQGSSDDREAADGA